MIRFIKVLHNKVWTQLVVIYTRYIIGGAFVFASIIKIKGKRFTTVSGENLPIDTAWHFFETMYQSGLYWQFLGLGQLLAGFLLMTQRHSKLGTLLFLPIIVNIFVITISYEFKATPIITGFMLLAITMLFFWEWNELKVIFNLAPVMESQNRFEHMKVWEWTGLALFLFTFGYRLVVDKYNILFWSGVCLVIGLIGLGVGYKANKKRVELLKGNSSIAL